MRELNAQISSTFLGIEDHGILSAMILCAFDGGSQGFGGYDLRRAMCPKFIERVLNVVGVRSWEALAGRYVRVRVDGSIVAIGHITENKWFNPQDEWVEFAKSPECNARGGA